MGGVSLDDSVRFAPDSVGGRLDDQGARFQRQAAAGWALIRAVRRAAGKVVSSVR